MKTPRGELYGDFRDLEVRSEVTGLVYSALNEKGEKIGTPLKSSLLGKEAGLDALKNRYIKSKETIKEKGLKQRSKTVISEVLQTCKTRTELEKALEEKNLSVLFRTTTEGRIYENLAR